MKSFLSSIKAPLWTLFKLAFIASGLVIVLNAFHAETWFSLLSHDDEFATETLDISIEPDQEWNTSRQGNHVAFTYHDAEDPTNKHQADIYIKDYTVPIHPWDIPLEDIDALTDRVSNRNTSIEVYPTSIYSILINISVAMVPAIMYILLIIVIYTFVAKNPTRKQFFTIASIPIGIALMLIAADIINTWYSRYHYDHQLLANSNYLTPQLLDEANFSQFRSINGIDYYYRYPRYNNNDTEERLLIAALSNDGTSKLFLLDAKAQDSHLSDSNAYFYHFRENAPSSFPSSIRVNPE